MMKSHEQWLEEAIRIADKNAKDGGGPFAAIIVRDHEIVSQGVNEDHIHMDPTAHAELSAIRKACIALQSTDLSDCIMYASGEPCPMCMGAIYWARLKAIYYACSKEEAAEAVHFPNPLHNFFEEMNQMPEDRTIPVYKLDVPDRLDPFHSWKNQTK